MPASETDEPTEPGGTELSSEAVDASPRALIQEAFVSSSVVILKTRFPGQTSVILLVATPRRRGVGLLSEPSRKRLWGGRAPPGVERQRAREVALVGSSVVALSATEVFLDQGGVARVMRAQGTRIIVADTSRGGTPLVDASEDQRMAWEAAGEALAEEVARAALDQLRANALRILDKARSRLARRREAIASDIGKIGQAHAWTSQATWLLAEAPRAPRGTTELVATDWSTGEGVEIRVALDPSRGAVEQVQGLFKRARRLKLGASVASARMAATELALGNLTAWTEKLRLAPGVVELDQILDQAKRTFPRDVVLTKSGTSPIGKSSGPAAPRRVPFRRFLTRSGRVVLVGQGGADNDALTQSAKPHHLWLHAKERTGAHVILVSEKKEPLASDDLVDAAHLAAHFSEARDETIVDVQYTEKRHLRKPKGSAAGLVVVDREKVLVLRRHADILATLLASEDGR